MSTSREKHPNADVRMRGFAERTTVEAALAWLKAQLAELGRLPSESASLGEAAGRVLADDAISGVNVPEFQRAMMDGFALGSADIQGASAEHPVSLEILGDAFPGQPFKGTVAAGQAVRIMTGAPLPAGVDAVLPVERTRPQAQQTLALQEIAPGKNVGRIGEDIRAGQLVLPAGRILRPQDVGVLSSIGYGEVPLVRRPRVRIVVTGNELLPAGTKPAGCRITDANGPMLTALVARDGGIHKHPGIVPDDREAILAALREEADVILVTGGSSVGQEDHVPTLLAEHGELAIHGIAMRPASPTGMGRLGGRLVFLIPGNPVACLCAYDFFAGPAIRALGGRSTDWPYRQVRAPLAGKLVSPRGRVDYARVRYGQGQVEPLAISGASVLSSTTRADGCVIIPADSDGYDAGAEVDVFLYD